MNNEIKEILERVKKHYVLDEIQDNLLLDYITNLQQENERLKQNQVNALNRIRDFINTSKGEIIEGSYCNDMHSQYWKMFKQFAEELKKKIKGLDTKDYVYIPKWREQELLSQEEQLEDYKSRIEKATNELFELKDIIYKPETRNENIPIQQKISSIIKQLNGRSDE